MDTYILPSAVENIALSIHTLNQGQIVALPSETVYGLAGNALSDESCLKIFQAKKRPQFNPLIVHIPKSMCGLHLLHEKKWIDVSNISAAQQTVFEILIQNFFPGPLTILLPKGKAISEFATSGLPNVAIRCPSHELFQKILENISFPLAAPSANEFGHVSPTSAKDVLKELNGKTPYILDGGVCEVGVESTIVGVNTSGVIEIYRHGKITAADFEKLNCKVQESSHDKVVAPGMLKSHYAPRKKTFYLNNILDCQSHQNEKFCVIAPHPLKNYEPASLGENIFSLSNSNDDQEAARNLFRILRKCDEDSRFESILILPVLEYQNLWLAIDDRLRKAAVSA